METDAEIDTKVTFSRSFKQVGLVQENCDGETPQVENGSQLKADASESFIQTRNIECA